MTIISDVTHTGESDTATVRDIQTPAWAERRRVFDPDETECVGEHLAAEFTDGTIEIHAAQQFNANGSAYNAPHVHAFIGPEAGEELTPAKARELAAALMHAADIAEAARG